MVTREGNVGEEIKEYKSVFTKELQGCKVHHRAYRQKYYSNYVWC